jgi:Domain of unknown function (DUF4265)
MTDTPEVKVVVDLPNHWATSGEGLWATSLGDDLYQLQNSPFYAYNLNYLDTVLATSERTDEHPLVREVVKRSGHATFRVVFPDSVDLAERVRLLETLQDLGVTYEGAHSRLFSLDVPPGSDPQAVRKRLDRWEKNGYGEYETCEERVPGSFDDRSEEGPADNPIAS